MKTPILLWILSLTFSLNSWAGNNRVYLCGSFDNTTSLLTLKNQQKQEVKILGLQLPAPSVGCAIGSSLPKLEGEGYQFSATKFQEFPLDLKSYAPNAIYPGAVGICGNIRPGDDKNAATLSLSASERVTLVALPGVDLNSYLKNTPENMALCAEGDQLPEAQEGAYPNFKTGFFRNDNQRSAVSIGNQ